MPAYHTILAPTDFSDPATAAVQAAAELAGQYRAELHLLHIVAAQVYYAEMPEMMMPPMEDITKQMLAGGEKKLKKLADELGGKIDVHTHIEESAVRPADAICETGGRIKADLIVIGSRGHTGLMHLLLGSTAERVVREAPCAVLVIKQ